MTPPLVELRAVSKVYAGPRAMLGGGLAALLRRRGPSSNGEAPPHLEVEALRGVSVSFARGELSAVAGPSGSGKSTLLNLVGTLDAPSSGEILFEGRALETGDPDALALFRLERLGFVFQAYNLIPVLTALENVEYPLVLRGVERGERRRRAREALASVGLEREAGRRPDLLSGGQQQRVAVARAVVHRPGLVLADEPTANLDSKTAEEVLDRMEALNRELGITFLFSSHDPQVLERARRVVRLHDGCLVSSGLGPDETSRDSSP